MKRQNTKTKVGAVRVAQVKERVKQQLQQYSNVVGLGVGLKRVGGQLTNEIALRVYVSQKLPKSELTKDSLLPERIEGVTIDVIEKRSRIFESIGDHRRRQAIMCGGISVGNPIPGGSGTIGAAVFDVFSGQQMILSNWHVLCGRLDCRPNERIIQPGNGGLDSGTEADVVGRLARWSLTSDLDCAVAFVSGHRFCTDNLLGLGRVFPVALPPTIGMQVWKSGRTTGVTTGLIADLDGDFDVNYDSLGIRHVTHQLVIESDGAVSHPGDSGSLFVDEGNHPVGLLFAGNDAGTSTDANPINGVMDALKFNFGPSVALQDFAGMIAAL